MDPIYITSSSLPEFEEYQREIAKIWDNRILTNMGEKHSTLETKLCEYLETENIALFSNGHMALECVIEAFELTGEVITTPFTFASTTHAIVRRGLEPVFCDINKDDYTIDASKIEALITDKTSAIMPVHVYGNLCDVKTIDKIAKKYNLKVIYDAAHTFGIKTSESNIADFADASMFSFHATKVFNTIEGGAVTCMDKKIIDKLNKLKNFGITGQQSVEEIGLNAKMNEFQAAMGICNLRHIEAEIEKRRNIFNRYFKRFKDINGLLINDVKPKVKGNYAYVPILIDGYKQTRDEVFEKLKLNSIFARKYFYPLTNTYECYNGRFDSSKTPVAKYVSDRILTLPIYGELKLTDVDRICDVILN